MTAIAWTQRSVAGAGLQHYTGRLGMIEVGTVMYDGSNKFWVWSTPLSDESWGYAPTEEGAKQALEAWLLDWLENFRPLFERRGPPAS